MCAQGYVTDVDKDTDTIVVQSDFVRIYSNPGIFVAFFQGCCRPNALVNNPNSPWRFETTVVCVYVVCVCVCVCDCVSVCLCVREALAHPATRRCAVCARARLCVCVYLCTQMCVWACHGSMGKGIRV